MIASRVRLFPVPSPRRGGLGRGEAPGTRYQRGYTGFRPSPSRGGGRKRGGFTLLEVILSLVILGAALAMLGEVMQLASRHAIEARAETQAQSLATSLMDQLQAGAIELESASRQALEVDDTTPWVYSVTIADTAFAGVQRVEVVVEQDLEARLTPVKFRLVRWFPTVLELPESASSSPSAGAGGQTGGAGGSSAPGGGTGGASL
jgi:prepilin-type N-terminal cleavage/methylation domain-containing protein